MRFHIVVLMALLGLAACHGVSPQQNTLTVEGGNPGSSCASATGTECIGH